MRFFSDLPLDVGIGEEATGDALLVDRPLPGGEGRGVDNVDDNAVGRRPRSNGRRVELRLRSRLGAGGISPALPPVLDPPVLD